MKNLIILMTVFGSILMYQLNSVSINSNSIEANQDSIVYCDPLPVLQFGNRIIRGGDTIPAAALHQSIGLKAIAEQCDITYEITEYTISYAKNGYIHEHRFTDSPFNDNAKAVLKEYGPGDRAFFEKIKAVGPDGKTRYLGSLVIYLR
jgi:hypothetical protein